MHHETLDNFCKQTPPAAMNRLPTPMFMSKNTQGTMIEFILRTYFEANDIVNRGDSLVKQIPFQKKDITPLLTGCDTLKKFKTSGEIDDAGLLALQETQEALDTVSRYHQEKVKAAQKEIERLTSEVSNIRIRFEQACRTGNTKTLLEFYPHLPDLLDLENDPDSRFIQTTNVTDLIAKRESRRKQKTLNNTVAEALEESSDSDVQTTSAIFARLSFTQFLGTPSAIEDRQQGVILCRNDITRNEQVLKAIQSVSEHLAAALNPASSAPAHAGNYSNITQLNIP